MKKRARLIYCFLLFLLWFIYFRPQFLGGSASYIIVSGISMEPTLKTGDLAILQKQDHYKPGDVIAYKVDGGQVIHRIIGGDVDGYLTQGDNKQITDPWTPSVEEILGKMWIFIPGAGNVLSLLRQPFGLITLGLLGTYLVFNEPEKKHKKKRRGVVMGSSSESYSHSLDEKEPIKPPQWVNGKRNGNSLLINASIILFVLFALIIAIAIYIGFLSFGKPIEEVRPVNVLTYTHSGKFNYTINLQPSTLYPGGIVKSPSSITPFENQEPAETVVFTNLAKSIDVDFSYLLSHDQSGEFDGELSHFLEIWSYETLLKSEPISQIIVFSGDKVSGQVSVDFQSLKNVIDSIEKDLGYSQGRYKIIVSSIVTINGSIGDRLIEDKFLHGLTFEFDNNEIAFDNKLSVSEEETVQEEISLPQHISFLGLDLPVQEARNISIWLGPVGLIVVGLSASVLFLGWGLSEAEKIRVRYGSMVVNVSKTRLQNNPAVRVASIEDLAKVAERTGSVICHVQQQDDAHFYFVPDAQVVYTYAISSKPQEGKAECDDS